MYLQIRNHNQTLVSVLDQQTDTQTTLTDKSLNFEFNLREFLQVHFEISDMLFFIIPTCSNKTDHEENQNRRLIAITRKV